MFEALIFFGLGCIIGSFLNVVLFRGERDESFVSGRSRCLTCDHTIAWYDNIPLVSYLLLQGACRHCKAKISWQYPLVEFFTGLLFLLVGCICFDTHSLFAWLETLWALLLVVFLVLIVVRDFRSMEIPLSYLVIVNIITLAYLTLQFIFFEEATLWRDTILIESILGGLVAGGFFFALVYFSRETWMGWGDVWIATLGGMTVGLSYTLPMLTTAFGVGALYGIILMYRAGKSLKTEVPFAPFLAFGILSILFLSRLFPEWFRFISW
jgi:leader peptidase (prepilin peptidase) / N-methyltransferase